MGAGVALGGGGGTWCGAAKEDARVWVQWRWKVVAHAARGDGVDAPHEVRRRLGDAARVGFFVSLQQKANPQIPPSPIRQCWVVSCAK